MWSGPFALCSLSVHRSLWMPFGVIMMCCMSGCGLGPLSGMVDVSSFWVNTAWKCWLNLHRHDIAVAHRGTGLVCYSVM